MTKALLKDLFIGRSSTSIKGFVVSNGEVVKTATATSSALVKANTEHIARNKATTLAEASARKSVNNLLDNLIPVSGKQNAKAKASSSSMDSTGYTTSTVTSTQSVYANIVGVWYQTFNGTGTNTNAFCLNSGVKSDGTVVAPTQDGPATTSNTITWTSTPGSSGATSPIPAYQEGQYPFNTVMFFPSTNDVNAAINDVIANTMKSSTTPYNCFQDAVNYFNTNKGYYANTLYGDIPNSQLIILTLGAGNTGTTGYWTKSVIAAIIDEIKNGTLSSSNMYYTDPNGGAQYGFGGICYDLETGDSGLEDAFTSGANGWSYNGTPYDGLFYATTNAGFGVFVTISHSAPYGFDDTDTIMEAVVTCPYVNQYILQLYTEPIGTTNEYASTNGISFEQVYDWMQASNTNWNGGVNNLIAASVYIYNGFNYSGTYYNGLFFGAGTNATGSNSNFQPTMTYNPDPNVCACSNVDKASPGEGYPFPYSNGQPPSNEFPDNTDYGAANFFNNVFGITMTSGFQWLNGNTISQLNP
jgi:hypothetical protein